MKKTGGYRLDAHKFRDFSDNPYQVVEEILISLGSWRKELTVLVFVSEYLTSGAWTAGDIPASLLREGGSMLSAIVRDFANIPGCRVLTTWDQRLGECPLVDGAAKNIEVRLVADPQMEDRAFEELCRWADAVMVIAPEFQNLLADRCERARESGTEALNGSVAAIHLCTDKFALARRLEELEIPTIPTRTIAGPHQVSAKELEFPLVIKPRDGAGSQETYLISGEGDWVRFQNDLRTNEPQSTNEESAGWIVQPYISGRALSIAAIVGNNPEGGEAWPEVFPIAEQRLTQDGRFGYLGGRIPAASALQHQATQRVREIVAHIPGLFGYIGFDLLAPSENPHDLLIVEINPRLTTSYLGYRALAEQSLAEYLLPSHRPETPLRWKLGTVQFTTDGIIRWTP